MPKSDVMSTISVVVPVYRSQDILFALYQRIAAAVEPLDHAFELILVEDCGGDCSWKIIEELAQQDARVKGIKLSQNFGQHNALLCGIRAASGAVIVTLDDDLQNPPEEISQLISKLDEGLDVVYGKPQQEQHSLLRNMASHITKLALHKTMGVEAAANISAFRVFRTHLRESFANYHSHAVMLDVLLTWSTTKFGVVKVRHDKRQVGVSGYTLRKLITHTFNIVTGFSTAPLQIASIAGLAFATLGLALLIYVLGRYFFYGNGVPGFTFLASVVIIFSGAQLCALGIFGEYLARMYCRSMGKPPYVEAKRTQIQQVQ